jgi:tRNA threonylcarbamoyladenosine biosynthesis protein TsaB
MILGIETATSRMSIALLGGGEIVGSYSALSHNAHDALLVPVVERMVRDLNLTMQALTAIAVSSGPGSFTGLRIGMAAAKGYALALGIPLITVPTFDAMATRAAERFRHCRDLAVFAPVFDARREDVYMACYALGDGAWQLTEPAAALEAHDAALLLPDRALLAGDGAPKLTALDGSRFILAPEREQFCHAEAVAIRAEQMLSCGEIADIETCEPLYLREFRTTTPKRPPLRRS